MAVIGMSIGMSFAFAMLLGPIVAASWGIAGVFWLTAILAVFGIFIVTMLVPNAVNKAPKGDTLASFSDIKKLIKHPQLARLNAGVLLLHLTLTTIFVVLPSQLIKDGLVADHHWYLYIPVLFLAFLLMVPIMIVAIKKEKEKQAFIGSVALLAISMLAMSVWVNSVVGIAVCMLLYFVAFNFLEATMPALVSRIAPASQKGSAMGGYSSSQFLGAFLGGMLGGYVAQTTTTQAVFAAAALVGLIWLIIAWKMQVPPKSKVISLITKLDSEEHAQTLASQLVALPGVIEATVVRDESRSYLKINDKEFDLDQARKVAGLI